MIAIELSEQPVNRVCHNMYETVDEWWEKAPSTLEYIYSEALKCSRPADLEGCPIELTV